ncbi:hypothetical protein PUH89_00800 [Rhodobacter capsulatus]|nr:hypothetical protein [Rhodobacter capsulatus]KQB11284.1 hypothetical protein AP073_08580 [Rhodobacter capsulatus]KQB14177.1 hypothetical protein AP071_16220 [Rhodobacter capsulatus]WER09548.1 hypothetical protein PUH89_00800 [Rhodobacter capsulatus]
MLLDVKSQDPTAIMNVPFWAWKDKQKKVMEILHAHRHGEELKWPWPLMRDVLPFCQAAFGGGIVEIAPRFIPIDNIPAFTEAERRIYMTATLADDGTGSVMWFDKQYDKSCSAVPIMVHKMTKPENAATLHPDTRIITEEKLDLLIARLKSYSVAVGDKGGFTEPATIAKQLDHFGLTAAKFVGQFTVKGS